jgi:hypothetical protein
MNCIYNFKWKCTMQAVTHSLWFIVTKICANITHKMNQYQDCNCDYTLLLVSFIILQMFHLEIKILICKWKCTSSYSLILTHSHQDMFNTSLILWTNTKIATVIIYYGTFSNLNNFTNVNLEIKILICKWKCTSSYSLILTHSHQDMFKTSLILWTNTKIATVIIHYGTFSNLNNFTNVSFRNKNLNL